MDKVIITVTTKGPEANSDVLCQEFTGTYYQRDGYHYIIYTDQVADTTAEIKTMLKFNDGDYLKVTRTGALKHQQEFQQGQLGHSQYTTPFGTMDMSHETKVLKIQQLGHKQIKLIYNLYISNVQQGVMDIEIKITPVQ